MNVEWRLNPEGGIRVCIEGVGAAVGFAPASDSQEAFLSSPITETLFEGGRGNGKSIALIADFIQHCGAGYGSEWRGLILRRSFPALEDLIAKTRKLFHEGDKDHAPLAPAATFKMQPHPTWSWPGGESLALAFLENPRDFSRYLGHAFTWIALDELAEWPTPECLMLSYSILRSPVAGIPLKIRATANPWGPGASFVKNRYRLPVRAGDVVGDIITDPDTGLERVAIHGSLAQNFVLTQADGDYRRRLLGDTNANRRAAWADGDWSALSGDFLADVFDRSVHVIPAAPMQTIPAAWVIDRSFDWGSSKPSVVLYWAESNGEPWNGVGHVRGDLVLVGEIYFAAPGEPNIGLKLSAREIAARILAYERELGVASRVKAGPADSAIFASSAVDPKKTVAGEMLQAGVRWVAAPKGAGSRAAGWEALRGRLANALVSPPEAPAMYVMDNCREWLRTVPSLPRSQRDPDDVDSDAEDHAGDATRYKLVTPIPRAWAQKWR